MYDVIIIGAGPAGLSASINTIKKHLTTLLLDKYDLNASLGGILTSFKEVQTASGDMLQFKKNSEVISVEKNVTSFQVELKTGESVFSKSLIIASGRVPISLNIKNETSFLNKGVSVIEELEVSNLKNKNIAVVGNGLNAMNALYLTLKVAKKIYSINSANNFFGDAKLEQKLLSSPAITFYSNSKAIEIKGGTEVKELVVQKSDGKLENLKLDLVLLETAFDYANKFEHLTSKNEFGEIKVNNVCATSTSGVFAAGSVTNSFKDPFIAIGEGAKAAFSASIYVSKLT